MCTASGLSGIYRKVNAEKLRHVPAALAKILNFYHAFELAKRTQKKYLH